MASSAFAVAILTGLFVGSDLNSAISKALAAMIVCYVVGRLVGVALEAIIAERLRAERAIEQTKAAPPDIAGSIQPAVAPSANRTQAA
jgi:ethanolamine transporter EutH